MLKELLRLKKDSKISTVFTRAGDMICQSRNSLPLRIADPEAVLQPSGDGMARSQAQRYADAGSGGAPQQPVRTSGGRTRERSAEPTLLPDLGGRVEVEASGPAGSLDSSLHGSAP